MLSHCYTQALQEPQWVNCDVRSFDMSVLGKFGVIMTDPVSPSTAALVPPLTKLGVVLNRPISKISDASHFPCIVTRCSAATSLDD
jgi:N6-adenosine-specific RNA methylase IME4